MTEDQFLKMPFKPFMEVDYMSRYLPTKTGDPPYNLPDKTRERTSCLVLAVDFEEKLFYLWLVPVDAEKEPFWARCEHVELPVNKPKIVK